MGSRICLPPVLSVRSRCPSPPAKETFPQWERIHYEFPGTTRTTEDLLKVVWHDGKKKPDPAEISRVLKIPLQLLVHTHLVQRFHHRIPDVKELRYPFQDVEVWGATARILHHFIELLFPLLDYNGKRLPGPVLSD